MSSNSKIQFRNAGFGLVEIMVGIAIAMIGVLVMMQMAAVFEGQKRTTTGGSDAQSNGAIGLFMVERDLRRAGYGLGVASALGCQVKRQHDDDAAGATPDLALTPITITDGAGGLPDAVRFLASSKGSWSVPSRITKDHPPQATNVFLNTVLGSDVGDMMIIHEAGQPICTLFQATGIPNGNVQVHHQNAGSNWNPPSGGDIYPAGGYGIGASVINMGTIIDRTYLLDAASNLVLADYSSNTNTTSQQLLISDIVQLQAEYGFDTRPGAQTDTRVDTWSSTMINADGAGTTGDSGDLQRIYAVRMAIVARSPIMEKPQTDGTCNVTTALPRWVSAGNLELDVSKNPDGTANANWRCYRYRVLDTVIPLRNLLWRE